MMKQEWFALSDLFAAQLPDLPRSEKALDNTRAGRDHVEGRHHLAGIQRPGDAE